MSLSSACSRHPIPYSCCACGRSCRTRSDRRREWPARLESRGLQGYPAWLESQESPVWLARLRKCHLVHLPKYRLVLPSWVLQEIQSPRMVLAVLGAREVRAPSCLRRRLALPREYRQPPAQNCCLVALQAWKTDLVSAFRLRLARVCCFAAPVATPPAAA